MYSELSSKVSKRVKGVGVVETALILAVAALHFAVMPWSIRADELVPNTKIGSSFFKERNKLAIRVCKAICELKPVVGLYALNNDALMLEEAMNLLQEIC